MIDPDAGTVAALRAYRAARGLLALRLVRDARSSPATSTAPPHSERFFRRFAGQVVRAGKALGEDLLPVIRLHDLRHTHATLLLVDGMPSAVRSLGSRQPAKDSGPKRPQAMKAASAR